MDTNGPTNAPPAVGRRPAGGRRLTQDEVIRRIEQACGIGVIGFNRFVFAATQTKATFQCLRNPAHRDWDANPDNLFKGQGCPTCGRDRTDAARVAAAAAAFQEDVEAVLGSGTIDLGGIIYKGGSTRSSVGCLRRPEHGKWTTTPANLKSGRGCPHCAQASSTTAAGTSFVAEVLARHEAGTINMTEAVYVDSQTKVTVRCLRNADHLPWKALPGNLKKGRGCPTCADERRGAAQVTGMALNFADRIVRIHGNGVIELSEAVYTGLRNRVQVCCLRNPAHGYWNPFAGDLLAGKGCPGCAAEARSERAMRRCLDAAERFPQRVIDLFGPGVIDASSASYIRNDVKVTVHCLAEPSHGGWEATPANLLMGFGCPRCGTARAAEKLSRAARESFLDDIVRIHGKGIIKIPDPSRYRRTGVPIEAQCLKDPGHGRWMAYPLHLKRGAGCPRCFKERRTARNHQLAVTAGADFSRRLEAVHGPGVIDCSAAEYVTARIPVTVRCLRDLGHGVWRAAPDALLSGSGCPVCSSSRGERAVARYLSDAGIAFEAQLPRFGRYRFDFHVPDLRLLIEYDGVQHFSPTWFGGSGEESGERLFQRIRKHDLAKIRWAEEKGFRLCRIAYTDEVKQRLDEEVRGVPQPWRRGLTETLTDCDVGILRALHAEGGDPYSAFDLPPAVVWQVISGVWRAEGGPEGLTAALASLEPVCADALGD
jgi:very-short-patch-repair endonuclease